MNEEDDDHPRQVRVLFDSKAATWSNKYALDGRLASRRKRFTDALYSRVPDGGRMLDLGCGTGDIARAAVNAGLKVTACDISSSMLQQAASITLDCDIEWRKLDDRWQTLPFEPDTFDAVVASSVLEYASRPGSILGECARVLRPGGVLLCTVPDTRHPIRWLEWVLTQIAQLQAVQNAGALWPRFSDYLTYLLISKNRRSLQWWHRLAEQVDLHAVRSLTRKRERSPLLMLMLRKPDRVRETK